MEQNLHSETARQMDKQGLRVFVPCAAMVYLLAMAYCYYTGHFFETGLVGAVMLGLGIFIANIFKSS